MGARGGAPPPPPKVAIAALFEPSAGLLPYPYDVYFAGSSDGTLNIQPANALIHAQDALNALDGFSTTAVIPERFAGPIDASSLGTRSGERRVGKYCKILRSAYASKKNVSIGDEDGVEIEP